MIAVSTGRMRDRVWDGGAKLKSKAWSSEDLRLRGKMIDGRVIVIVDKRGDRTKQTGS